MATLIGLTLLTKLSRSLPPTVKITVLVKPETHVNWKAIGKQLKDKERVRAAMENEHLRRVVEECIAGNS